MHVMMEKDDHKERDKRVRRSFACTVSCQKKKEWSFYCKM